MSEDAAGEDRAGTRRGDGLDPVLALGLAVVLAALAGVAALLAGHLLLGWLRLLAGVLAGGALGAAILALPGARPGPRARRVLSLGLALVLAAALILPAVRAARPDDLAERASTRIAPLAEGDAVASVPVAGSPVLVRRADGSAQLLTPGAGAVQLETAPGDVLALSADGTRLVQVSAGVTRVTEIDPASDGRLQRWSEVAGEPLALAGDVLVVRACAEGVCRTSGVDLEAPTEPLWTVTGGAADAADGAGGEASRGPDPVGVSVPARPDAPAGLLDAVTATGVLGDVPLHADPVQGWVQLDPATGFPVGQVLATPDQDCRIAATTPAPAPASLEEDAPVVLTACSAEDGALTVTAFRHGSVLWTSDPSPAGDWEVRLEDGRVLATGTEAGTEVAGEIVASGERAAWTAPGGETAGEILTPVARIGLDGSRMVLANDASQLVAHDLATGENTWTAPLLGDPRTLRGGLGAGSVVVLERLPRERALDPRPLQRLRVLDAASGQELLSLRTAAEITDVRPVGGGRALVTSDGSTLLLGG